MKLQLVTAWIVSNLSIWTSHVNLIAVYGSIARGANDPNDCDLIIVTWAKVESDEWELLRRHIKTMKVIFLDTFELPLNVVLLTEAEWQENKSFYKDLLEITASTSIAAIA